MTNAPINQNEVKRITHPSLCIDVQGEMYMAMITALRYASHHAPGALKRKHASVAYSLVVESLPIRNTSLVILTRAQFLALVDGVEALIDVDTIYEALHSEMVRVIERSAKALGHEPMSA